MIEKNDYIWISFLLVAALGISVLFSKNNPYLIVIIPIAFMMLILILNEGELCFLLIILLLPLLSSVWLSYQIFPIAGARVNNLLLLCILIGILLNMKMDFEEVRLGTLFYFGSLSLFLIAVMNSQHTEPHFRTFWNEDYSLGKFFLSHGLIPIFTTLPTLVIIGTVRSKERIFEVTRYLAYSMLLFSFVILGLFFIKVPGGSDFSEVRQIIGIKNLGMHGNNIADFFIVAFPLMFILSLLKTNKYRKLYMVTSAMSVMAVLITYSRTAYMMLLLSVISISFLSKRYKLLLGVALILLCIAFFMPSVANRAISEIDTGHAGAISAGRTNLIWDEILKDLKFEYQANPIKLIIGHGRYGVLSLNAFNNQRMLPVTHAHNMYLDTFIDTGAIGLIFYMTLFLTVIVRLSYQVYLYRKQEDLDLAYLNIGLLIGLIAFMGRGLSDSFFLPQLTNSYAYIFMGLSFSSFAVRSFGGSDNEKADYCH